ncbi:glycoside hydrolase domain-containing protein [Psychrobacillus sp. FSL H8-0484]|uniref:glycoside hydrolase domain-containing protein n=1 Tax=Psychrobacillus sp. FSL H8-0484 TaxID=2921390 RepID=UPI0030F51BC0
MDEMVLTVQRWLNSKYRLEEGWQGVPETGKTGLPTMYGLTRALQIELGVRPLADSFGPLTASTYKQWGEMQLGSVPTNDKGKNIVQILQGACFCKGYNPGGFDGSFGERTKSAVLKLQTDAWLPVRDGKVYDYIFKAFLTMDAFVLVPGGDSRIREIQQNLNYLYYQTAGVQPTDGIYQRNTNKALIYGLQTEIGIPPANQTGAIGPATTAGLPTLMVGSKGNFVRLFQYALYVNNHDSGVFDGIYGNGVKAVVAEFQRFVGLVADGIAGKQTWLSVLISTGDPNRKGTACDCITMITPAKAQALKSAGYKTVGRYLTNASATGLNKKIQPGELKNIFDAGLTAFPIYQTIGNVASYFNPDQGKKDARAANAAAQDHGFKKGVTIYFAVDFDAYGGDITNNILPHFKAIKETLDFYGKYEVGVYGPRNICIQVSEAGYAKHSFVCGMSTGFSGNLGYPLPSNWSFDQISTVWIGSGDGRIEIDNNINSGKDPGAGSIDTPSSKQDVDLKSEYEMDLRTEAADYIHSVMTAGQIAVVLWPREVAVQRAIDYDDLITDLSNKYQMRKALIQTVLAWESALIGPDDIAGDALVSATHQYYEYLEAWEALSPELQAITPRPIPPLVEDDDSSTGWCQIFARTAIKGLNFAKDKGWRTGKTYDPDNLKDVWEVWRNLKEDDAYNISVAALVLLWGAESDLNLSSDYLSYGEEDIKRVLARYNGTNEKAKEYGERNYGTYQVFEKYNALSRNN